MTVIYTAEQTASIFFALTEAEMGNNGYANVPTLDTVVVDALAIAGFRVTAATDGFGCACSRVFTPKGWAAAVAEHNARGAAVLASFNRAPSFDYEGAILARNDAHLFA
jgi:hypothetical protein